MLAFKKTALLLIVLFHFAKTFSQNIATQNDLLENLIESIAEQSEESIDYTNLLDELNNLLENPLDLNLATSQDLEKIPFLNQNQIVSFIKYRESTGSIYSLFELQVIPGFSYEIIRTMEPLVKIGDTHIAPIKSRSKNLLLLKTERTLEKEKGYSSEKTESRYLGNPWKYYSRYQFSSPKRNLNLGFTTEKDKGEPFFEGKNANGFDFYSAFLQLNAKGLIRQLNLGDFQVKFGQGLNLGSGLSGGKSSFTTQNANKSNGIKSYHSTDENQFFRGFSLLLQPVKNTKFALFASSKKRDASLNSDSISSFITSFQSTGFHRNKNEMNKKHELLENILGSYFLINFANMEMGLSFLGQEYSHEIRPEKKAYNLYNFRGNKNHNLSFHYSSQFQSIQLYGEIAQSKSGGNAFLQGMNIQAHPQLNLEFIYRKYDQNYHGMYSNAFAEQGKTQNEEGFYVGAEFHPFPKWSLKTYYDLFRFPWLNSTSTSPTQGHEYFSQVEFTPNSSTSVYFRFKREVKPKNDDSDVIKIPVDVDKNQYRIHLSAKMDENWEIRNRVEFSSYKKENSRENGFLVYQDLIYHFTSVPISVNARYALFDTDSYDTRIYAYENDILYAYSVPAFYSKGAKFYLNINCKLSKECTFYAKYAQIKYSDHTSISSGSSEISGNTKSEIKLMLKFRL